MVSRDAARPVGARFCSLERFSQHWTLSTSKNILGVSWFSLFKRFFLGGKCKAVLADVDPVSQGGVLKVLGILGAESCGKLSQSVSG